MLLRQCPPFVRTDSTVDRATVATTLWLKLVIETPRKRILRFSTLIAQWYMPCLFCTCTIHHGVQSKPHTKQTPVGYAVEHMGPVFAGLGEQMTALSP